ncbi:MAG: restriction endonuclease [Desulfobacterales bacterium]
MARRSGSVLDEFVKFPWWVSVILSVVVYLSFTYLLPLVAFQNFLFKGIAEMMTSLAPALAGLLLLVAGVSAFDAWRKGQLIDRQKGTGSLQAVSWKDFEDLVGEAYRRKGYSVTESGGGGPDGGVDLVLKKNDEKILVQCKHWEAVKIGVKIIRELYGVVAAEGATGGIVITSGQFTWEAREFARGKPIELIDGNQLQRLIAGVQKNPDHTADRLTEIPCPLCGAEMVLRTAKKGARAGEKFWGCATFPKCRGIRSYTE